MISLLLADLFYMKTCHYRGARPLPSPHRGLFLYEEAQVRYGMVRCQQRSCRFCFPLPYITGIRRRNVSSIESVVQFTATQKHRFVSGYEAILNCPTVCCHSSHTLSLSLSIALLLVM